MTLSKSQIDKLGERLRLAETPSPDDDVLLDDYRQTFAKISQELAADVNRITGLTASSRPDKSTLSITAKLKREPSLRLSRMQDIAGCRVIVSDIRRQNALVASLSSALRPARIVDRREKPSHGYRGVHLIVEREGKPMEVQVQTQLQNAWAQWCEALASRHGWDIKYGGGPPELKALLRRLSKAIEVAETTIPSATPDQTIRQITDMMVRHFQPVNDALDALMAWESQARARRHDL